MSKLLIAEPPLQVLPSLAVAIGLNEAIIVQQIHYWVVGKSGKVIDGQRWIYNGYREWKEQFPFWSEDTIQRAFRSAENQGVIVSQHQKGFDRRKLYRIDYSALDNRIFQASITATCGDGDTQIADISTPQNAAMLTETTTETTTKTPAPKARGNPELYALAVAIAEVCQMDFRANEGRLFSEAKLLSKASPAPTPENIKASYNGDARAYWKSQDWRGKAGQPPTPQAIRETWARANKHAAPSKTQSPQDLAAMRAALAQTAARKAKKGDNQ